ncbi:MAG: hypothetical protein ACRDOD_22325 [Streptosporangiaceae bacterium]
MSDDIDGYGFAAEGRSVGRLTADLRELDRSGIERIAGGFDRLLGAARMDEFRAAEQAASKILAQEARASDWHEVRESLIALTAGPDALVSWRSESGETGRNAQRAVLMAALALIAGVDADHPELEILLRPAGAALPWLLADGPAEPQTG